MKWQADWVIKGDQFGRRVDARGPFVASGAHRYNKCRGAVGILNVITGEEWMLSPRDLLPAKKGKKGKKGYPGHQGDQFGAEVKLRSVEGDGMFLYVGAVGADAVWIFKFTAQGWVEA